jgi:hypothetical protein
MLPLAGEDFPRSLDQFVTALRAGLEDHQVVARDVRAAGEWPALEELSLNLTGAQLSRATPISKPATNAEPGPSIACLTISARPLDFESVPLVFDLQANDAQCGFARDEQRGGSLQILQAKSGTVVLEAKRSDLELFMQKLAAETLAKHGAEVKSTHLEFTSHSPRALRFQIRVKAKVFVMNADIIVSGELSIDDGLNLRAQQLTADGNGMIASLATSYLRPRFAELEKRVFPLATFSVAEVKLRDVQVSGGETLRLDARFGE